MTSTKIAAVQMAAGTATEWRSVNPVLQQGEYGLETDTRRKKLGNGSSTWADLPYEATSAVVGPSPVTTRSKGAVFGSETSDGVATGHLTRLAFTFLEDCSSVELLYANVLGGDGVEADGRNDITVWCAVEDPVSGTPRLLTPPAGLVLSPNGSVWVSVPGYLGRRGETLVVRSQVSVAAGGVFPMPLKAVGPADGRLTNPGATNVTTSTAASAIVGQGKAASFGPVGVRGVPEVGSPAVLALGTSIGAGAGSSTAMTEEAGWYKLALSGSNIPCHNIAFPSSSAHQAATWEQRFRRFFTTEGTTFTDGLIEHGTNDFIVYNLATMQADILLLAQLFRTRVERLWIPSTPPRTSDTAGTTPTGREAYRQAWNAWLRDGMPIDASTGKAVTAGTSSAVRCDVYNAAAARIAVGSPAHPFTGVWEVADTVESARNSGVWRSPALTSDGVHPSSAGHQLMAAAVPVAAMQ